MILQNPIDIPEPRQLRTAKAVVINRVRQCGGITAAGRKRLLGGKAAQSYTRAAWARRRGRVSSCTIGLKPRPSLRFECSHLAPLFQVQDPYGL